MTQSVLTFLLWFSALGSGLVAGLFFAFSAVIMTAFGRIPQEHGVAAMQSINSTILRSLFMPVFFGTALVSLVLVGVASFRLGEPGDVLNEIREKIDEWEDSAFSTDISQEETVTRRELVRTAKKTWLL